MDGIAAFRPTTLVVKESGLVLTADLRMKDLDMATTSATIDLKGHVLRLSSFEHKGGKGWARTYGQCVIENGGKIVWPGGLVFIIR